MKTGKYFKEDSRIWNYSVNGVVEIIFFFDKNSPYIYIYKR